MPQLHGTAILTRTFLYIHITHHILRIGFFRNSFTPKYSACTSMDSPNVHSACRTPYDITLQSFICGDCRSLTSFLRLFHFLRTWFAWSFPPFWGVSGRSDGDATHIYADSLSSLSQSAPTVYHRQRGPFVVSSCGIIFLLCGWIWREWWKFDARYFTAIRNLLAVVEKVIGVFRDWDKAHESAYDTGTKAQRDADKPLHHIQGRCPHKLSSHLNHHQLYKPRSVERIQ